VKGRDTEVDVVIVICGSTHMLQAFVCETCSYGLAIWVSMFENWVQVSLVGVSKTFYG